MKARINLLVFIENLILIKRLKGKKTAMQIKKWNE
jgi:hypothetical protein